MIASQKQIYEYSNTVRQILSWEINAQRILEFAQELIE